MLINISSELGLINEVYNQFFETDAVFSSTEINSVFKDIVSLQDSGLTNFDELHYAFEDGFSQDDTLDGEFLHTFILNRLETIALELNTPRVTLKLNKDSIAIDTLGQTLKL